MYIKILLNYLLGYVNIIVEGFFVERFINICMSKNIFLWKIKRDKSAIISANVGIQDFKNAVKIAKQTKCKIKIQSKKGMPFIFNKYKKRKIFAIFFIIILILIYISSRYVWNVEINVEDNLKVENIRQDLEEAGLKRGILKKQINAVQIINNLRIKRNDLAWVRNRYKRNERKS